MPRLPAEATTTACCGKPRKASSIAFGGLSSPVAPLVATVLPIPDDAGRALMVRHHRHLASGLTPAAFSYVCYGAG